MAVPCQIEIYDNQELVHSVDCAGPVELGRQNTGEPEPYYHRNGPRGWRVVIAGLEEDTVSRRHALLEPLSDASVRLTNLSGKQPVRLADGREVRPGASCDVTLPAAFAVGARTVRVRACSTTPSLQTLSEATRPPGQQRSRVAAPAITSLVLTPGVGPDVESLVRWLQTTLEVFQCAAGSSDFFGKAAQAVVDLVGLDTGVVLLRSRDKWEVAALRRSRGEVTENTLSEWQPSRQVLNRVCTEKRTMWQVPEQPTSPTSSLAGLLAVVSAPILDLQGNVIGALYGERRTTLMEQVRMAASGPISKPQAMLVELLATGVASGLTRIEQEKAALGARVMLEQFFTPELSRHLTARPELLQGHDCEVTVLFCDIRGFSRISERLGPAKTIDWLQDSLRVLSECALERHGVLVDYTGDELMAMWGAPDENPAHPEIACRAALSMLQRLPELNERWQGLLGEPMDLGIGLNTGRAHVGNTGSSHKFKYGPLGNTVNLASRVQGATKHLKTRLLITGSTQARLSAGFHVRRLCTVKVVNIKQPVELFELVPEGLPGWAPLKEGYEAALANFEKGQLRPAARVLGNLVIDHAGDGPSLVLLSRTVTRLVEEGVEFNPVWELPGK
jgi:adenylate cyclase